MPIKQGTPTIITTAANANVTAHTYTVVYAASAQSPVINGQTIPMGAGSSINILVKSISSTADVSLTGHPTNTFAYDTNLGSISM